jgi:5-methyltetrahydropteroyltriglutamate--homocysteine methyltransferase
MPKHLLPTTVIGSHPQPEWLVDPAMLSKVVPRTRLHAMWRLPEQHLEEAQDDATIVAIRDMRTPAPQANDYPDSITMLDFKVPISG